MKGFTLIETIIYIAIIGGIMAAFVNFALNVSDSNNKTFEVEEVQANARQALHIISQKIRSAKGVNIDSSIFNIDPGVLSLAMTSGASDPTIISLNKDDGSLQIKEGAGSAVMVTAGNVKVTNLVFSNLSASSTRENIGIDLTVEYASSTESDLISSQTLYTAVGIRE